jgi:tellurite methyltransferase
MTQDEKHVWDQKHRERSHSSMEPDPLLVSAYSDFLSSTPGGAEKRKALDIAGGVGRHAVWLAERGWQVRLLDISDVAIEQARENARLSKAGGSIVTEIQDLDGSQDFGLEQYDLIVCFFFLQCKLFPALAAALKPGGHLIYKTYTTEHTQFGKGPSHPMFLLEPNELLRAFSSMRILHYHETTKEKGVAELVARKGQESLIKASFEPRATFMLSLQRALLGEITHQLFSVTCGMKGKHLQIRAYVSGDVTQEDIERIQTIRTEVIADFPEGYSIEESCLPVAAGEKMLDFWVFRRAPEAG